VKTKASAAKKRPVAKKASAAGGAKSGAMPASKSKRSPKKVDR
jgi:hypothetical protein